MRNCCNEICVFFDTFLKRGMEGERIGNGKKIEKMGEFIEEGKQKSGTGEAGEDENIGGMQRKRIRERQEHKTGVCELGKKGVEKIKKIIQIEKCY